MRPSRKMREIAAALVFLIVSTAAGCATAVPMSTPTALPIDKQIVLYDWAGYMPQTILDAFQAEFGVQVTYLTYENQDQAVAEIKAGKEVDVLVMGGHTIPELIADGMLAEIDYRNVPNFKNISANFRDLAIDPANKHSILFEWGTTGIIVRQDLAAAPVTRWADLWDTRYAGKIGVWRMRRHLTGIALKSLGYSINSEDPAELAAASDRLLALKRNVFFIDPNIATGTSELAQKKAVMFVGWSYDALEARQQYSDITYVVPQEGTILWNDSLTIPSRSQHKHTAELFINFLLRPEISAQFVNENYVATGNEAAEAFIKPELRNNPIISPPIEVIQEGEWTLPLSPEGNKLSNELWQRFLDAGQ